MYIKLNSFKITKMFYFKMVVNIIMEAKYLIIIALAIQ